MDNNNDSHESRDTNKVILTLGRVSVTDSPGRVEGVHSNPPHPLCVLALGERLQLGDSRVTLVSDIGRDYKL